LLRQSVTAASSPGSLGEEARPRIVNSDSLRITKWRLHLQH
jgi:hypothetical protein